MTAQEQLEGFTLATLPDLDVVTLGALELFSQSNLPRLPQPTGRTLVLGSGNAAIVGQMLFSEANVRFATASNYREAIQDEEYEEVIVMSASGGKHAVPMVQAATEEGHATRLITSTAQAPAAAHLPETDVLVFPKNREPYTYNTSTYLGPLIAATQESADQISTHIATSVTPRLLRHFENYSAYCFILPDEFKPVCGMINTKFDELFGPMVVGRAFTSAEMMHAKTVVPSGDELFIAIGEPNDRYGLPKHRLQFELPTAANWASVIAISYFVVGKIQAAHPPYFKTYIEEYCTKASQWFGQTITPIVE